MKATKKLTLFAPAKLNLFLEVQAQRSDGYHDLESIFQTIDLCDELTIAISPLPAGAQTSFSLELPASERSVGLSNTDNLILRAAALFFQSAQGLGPLAVSFSLKKKIPIAAGLAGGSTDAAATIYGLNYLLNEPLNETDRLALCRQLGADVPFCLLQGCMLGRGRGDELLRLPMRRDLSFLLLLPPASELLTAQEVYQRFDQIPRKEPSREGSSFIRELMDADSELACHCFNALQEAAISLNHWAEHALSSLEAIGLQGLVSGSGPTVFAPIERLDPNPLINRLQAEGFEVALHRPVDGYKQIVGYL